MYVATYKTLSQIIWNALHDNFCLCFECYFSYLKLIIIMIDFILIIFIKFSGETQSDQKNNSPNLIIPLSEMTFNLLMEAAVAHGTLKVIRWVQI